MTRKKELPNFIECQTVDEANSIDMSEYRLERYDEKHHLYIFVRRAKRMGL